MDNFTDPICKKCKVKAEIIEEDNGACGDPECCGAVSEWAVAECPKCKVRERISPY